jgi:hypothetical protein
MAASTILWLKPLRAYFAVIVLGNLAWEVLQLPLYTIWATGSLREQAFAAVHCTGGDILIALAALTLALALLGERGFWPVALLALGIGVAYTGLSEWLNVYVRKSWAYSQWMPVLPIGSYRIGLSPLLQWMLVPGAALCVAGRMLRREAERVG